MLEMSPSHAYVYCDYTQNVLKSKCLEWQIVSGVAICEIDWSLCCSWLCWC